MIHGPRRLRARPARAASSRPPRRAGRRWWTGTGMRSRRNGDADTGPRATVSCRPAWRRHIWPWPRRMYQISSTEWWAIAQETWWAPSSKCAMPPRRAAAGAAGPSRPARRHRGHPAAVWYQSLAHDPSVLRPSRPGGDEVRGRVGEGRQLIVSGGDVHDRVGHQVHEHEPEGSGHVSGGHVADGYQHGAAAPVCRLAAGSCAGQLDAMHLDPPRAQRQRHAPGTDRVPGGSPAPESGSAVTLEIRIPIDSSPAWRSCTCHQRLAPRASHPSRAVASVG